MAACCSFLNFNCVRKCADYERGIRFPPTDVATPPRRSDVDDSQDSAEKRTRIRIRNRIGGMRNENEPRLPGGPM